MLVADNCAVRCRRWCQYFSLNYFGQEAYLAQSPQFYKQMMVGVFEHVFEIASVFRAEGHDTSRHLNEYTSVDFEPEEEKLLYELIYKETGSEFVFVTHYPSVKMNKRNI